MYQKNAAMNIFMRLDEPRIAPTDHMTISIATEPQGYNLHVYGYTILVI